MNEETKKVRNYGIDLMRICSMLFITILHTIEAGGIIDSMPLASIRFYVISAIRIFCLCGVNCYALISGFVGCDKKFKISRIIKLWIQVEFYSIGITALYLIFRKELVPERFLFKSCFPIIFDSYWYITSYFGLLFFMPILNSGIKGISKKEFSIIVIAILCLFSIFPFFIQFEPLGQPTNQFWLNRGFSLMWLMALYIIGAYIKMYDPFKNRKWYTLLFGCIVLIGLSVLYKYMLEKHYNAVTVFSDAILAYTQPAIVIASILLFSIFAKINITNNILIKIIKPVSEVSLGVYLIHVHRMLLGYTFRGFALNLVNYNIFALIACIVLYGVTIYAVCGVIDYIRIVLFKLIRIDKLIDKTDKILD